MIVSCTCYISQRVFFMPIIKSTQTFKAFARDQKAMRSNSTLAQLFMRSHTCLWKRVGAEWLIVALRKYFLD